MMNKIMVGILALLVLLTAGLGYYTYTLNRQIDDLSEQLTSLETEQAAGLAAVSGEITDLRQETTAGLADLDESLGLAQAEITGLNSRVAATEDRIDEAVAGIAGSILDASAVYEEVSRVTVRITNGEGTIGSGVIWDAAGHVVTAHHVIEDLSPIYVVTADGQVSPATVTGSCPYSDVGVLELQDNPGIAPLPLADSGQVQIGEPVVAFGNPLDMPDTLTAGIVSQVNRFVEIDYDSQTRSVPNLIQFDAPVNPGNSGCPLANASGELLGIVIARLSPGEGDGIYYAVAANKVARVAQAIIVSGSFDYPWLGVSVSDLTPNTVEEKGLASANGVLVAGIFPGDPAQTAGVRIGDVIVSLDGVPLRDTAGLTSYLGEFKSPGDTCRLGIIRDGESLSLDAVLTTRTI
jgi:S1-C subfamily serine protease